MNTTLSPIGTPDIHRPTELALLGLLAMLWGSSYLLIKVAVVELPPLTLIALRVAVAAALLMAVVRWQRLDWPRARGTWARLGTQSFLNSIGAWTLLAWGTRDVDSALAGILNSTAPIFVVIAGFALTRSEPTSPRRVGGAALGLVGVVLILGGDALYGLGDQLLAQLAVLASAILYAGAAIHGRRFAALHPAVTAACTMGWASAVLVPLALWVDRPWTVAASPQALSAALLLGVACTACALLLYFRLLRTLGSLGTASQAYLRAVVSVLLGVWVLGEALSASIAVGAALAIGGVVLINASPVRRRDQ